MKTRIFTYLGCKCGHRGAIVESIEPGTSAVGWYQAWLRNLSHTGQYDDLDELFAETKPGCPKCGQSLGPEHIVGRSVQSGQAELLPRSAGNRAESMAIDAQFSALHGSPTALAFPAGTPTLSMPELP